MAAPFTKTAGESYVPAVDLSKVIVGNGPEHVTGLDREFRRRLEELYMAAPDEIRYGLGLSDGARSIEEQRELWEKALKKYGSAEAADDWVARPGGSFHGKGLAADLT